MTAIFNNLKQDFLLRKRNETFEMIKCIAIKFDCITYVWVHAVSYSRKQKEMIYNISMYLTKLSL